MRSTMSSAWSHGTFCRRSVTLPLTESLTTMFWPLASASSCSTARVSMSWKLSVRRSPVYTGLSSGCVRRPCARLHLDDVLVVGLVGELLEVAGGVDRDARAVADARDVEAGDRRAEIGRVVAAHQVRRHLGVGEVDHDLVADLAQVDLGVRVGELHDHAAGAVGAAAEVDAADRARPPPLLDGAARVAARAAAAAAALAALPARRA